MNFDWRQNAIGGLLDQGYDRGRFVGRNTECKRAEVGGRQRQHIRRYHNSKLKSMAIYCIRIAPVFPECHLRSGENRQQTSDMQRRGEGSALPEREPRSPTQFFTPLASASATCPSLPTNFWSKGVFNIPALRNRHCSNPVRACSKVPATWISVLSLFTGQLT